MPDKKFILFFILLYLVLAIVSSVIPKFLYSVGSTYSMGPTMKQLIIFGAVCIVGYVIKNKK
ncbi:hypothetical protein SAMN02745245_01076 [Anaerosphaera aminiphila DSM 21120]|uniref:Uncharacterized protein n=1 Tax=Anaerosphaera aminiphila DSM 21120 TaxID=1120995 RepID=A0A1M5S106_9FIRM|nr:hypothetical protein [Anaerosphaera aminiphila]SHH32160.1 hypothetical protein SAMN02745245_01076 [Anaerosphaera aminiphila DSM 21120]